MAEEAKKDAAGGEEEGGKKKLPLWVIILIASQVVVVGIAIVVFKMMSGAPVETAVDEEGSAESEAAAPAEGGHDGAKAEGGEKAAKKEEGGNGGGGEKAKDPKSAQVGPQFELEPFIVNLIDDGRGPRYLKVDIKFELENEGIKDEITSRLSQIRDEMLTLLSSKRQTDVETTDGKRILKDEIFTRVNKVLVTGRVKRVYFTEFVIQ